jgi:hypothetical protein
VKIKGERKRHNEQRQDAFWVGMSHRASQIC